MAKNIIEFIKAAVKNPMQVSTVFPTSKNLAETIISHVDLKRAESVVELGAGTGAITKHLFAHLSSKEKYLGVELNSSMVEFLRQEFSGVHFEAGPAENLLQWVPENGVDIVISSLPWSLFNDNIQDRTINAILKSLKPGGVFITYICVHALTYRQAGAFLKRLNNGFSDVYQSPLEWRNIPPAYIFKSTKG